MKEVLSSDHFFSALDIYKPRFLHCPRHSLNPKFLVRTELAYTQSRNHAFTMIASVFLLLFQTSVYKVFCFSGFCFFFSSWLFKLKYLPLLVLILSVCPLSASRNRAYIKLYFCFSFLLITFNLDDVLLFFFPIWILDFRRIDMDLCIPH